LTKIINGCYERNLKNKKVAKLTAIDSSEKMLELLKEKCEKKEIANVDIIQGKLEEVKAEDIGNYDIVLFSIFQWNLHPKTSYS